MQIMVKHKHKTRTGVSHKKSCHEEHTNKDRRNKHAGRKIDTQKPDGEEDRHNPKHQNIMPRTQHLPASVVSIVMNVGVVFVPTNSNIAFMRGHLC